MQFEIYKDKADEYRWRLIAANGKIVADSGEGYKNHVDAHYAILSIQALIASACVVDAAH